LRIAVTLTVGLLLAMTASTDDWQIPSWAYQELSGYLQMIDNGLSETELPLTQIEQRFSERERDLMQRETLLAEREIALQQTEARLAERKQALSEREQGLDERESLYADTRKQLQEAQDQYQQAKDRALRRHIIIAAAGLAVGAYLGARLASY